MKDKLRIAPVRLEDFHSMDLDWSNHIDHSNPNYWDIILQVSATAGLWINEQLMLILGLFYDGEGVGTMFVISSVHVRERWVQRYIVKYANIGLQLLQGLYPIHRLQAVVNPNNQAHVSFIKHYGFKYEGTLVDYTPAGLDVHMYAKSMRRV